MGSAQRDALRHTCTEYLTWPDGAYAELIDGTVRRRSAGVCKHRWIDGACHSPAFRHSFANGVKVQGCQPRLRAACSAAASSGSPAISAVTLPTTAAGMEEAASL